MNTMRLVRIGSVAVFLNEAKILLLSTRGCLRGRAPLHYLGTSAGGKFAPGDLLNVSRAKG